MYDYDDRYDDEYWTACAEEYEAEQAQQIGNNYVADNFPGLDPEAARKVAFAYADGLVDRGHMTGVPDGDGDFEVVATEEGESLARLTALRAARPHLLLQPKPRLVLRSSPSCRPQRAARRVRAVRRARARAPGSSDDGPEPEPPEHEPATASRAVAR